MTNCKFSIFVLTLGLLVRSLLLALPVYGEVYTSNSDWTQPFVTDQYTMGLWHFDETPGDGSVSDASGNNPDGTMTYGSDENQLWVTSAVPYAGFGNMASTWYDPGTNTWMNGAIRVAGTGDNNTDPLWGGPLKDLTIEFWARSTWSQSWRFLVEKSGGLDYYVAYDAFSPYNLRVGWNEDWTTGPAQSGDWHHYAICLDRTTDNPQYTDNVTFFVDGALVGSITGLTGAWYQPAGDLYILGDSGGGNLAFAEMDELRISNCIRYTLPPPPPDVLQPDEHTRGLWYFNQQPGDVAVIDASDYGNDGQLSSSLDPDETWVTSMPEYNNCARTWYNTPTDFNRGRIEAPQSAGNSSLSIGPNADLSIEFWMYPTSNGTGSGRLIVAKSLNIGADYSIYFGENNHIFYHYYKDGGFTQQMDTSTTVPLNEWTHIAVLVDRTSSPDADTLWFFYNGQQGGSYEVPPAVHVDDDGLNMFGVTTASNVNSYDGLLDELRISDVIRDYSKITWIKNAGDDIQFEFSPTRLNTIYTIYSANSPAGPWSKIQSVFSVAGQTVVTIEDALVDSNKQFYRISKSDKIFEDVTDEMGLTSLGIKAGWGSYPAWAAGWGDYNKDGYVDFYCGGLWRNNNGSSFTKMAIIPATAGHSGIWGDYDNDGFDDLYTFGSDNPPYVVGRLLRNVNGTSFVDVSGSSLPVLPMTTPAIGCWGDFDGDGSLDLYLGGGENPGAQPDAILWNNGNGTFSLDTKVTGRVARGITAADFDNDNDLDIYVSHYRLDPNILWLNDGYRTFNNRASDYGVSGVAHTIGSSWGDLDNDGYLDLFVGNFSHWGQQTPRFLKNLGPSGSYYFQDNSAIADLAWRESYATPALGDFDNDGYLDIFLTSVATNFPDDESVLLHNNGDWAFTELSSENIIVYSNYQSTWADYDNDGDLDLLTGNRLFKNPGSANHWLKVKLIGNGTTVNKTAIGAKVLIDLGGGTRLIRQVEGATGAGNQNDLTMHFGLGSNTSNVNLNITWPDGSTQLVNTAVDQLVTVTQ